MGHLAKSAFAIVFGKNSTIDVKFCFYLLRCLNRVYAITNRVSFGENSKLRSLVIFGEFSVKAQNSTYVCASRTYALGEFHPLDVCFFTG